MKVFNSIILILLIVFLAAPGASAQEPVNLLVVYGTSTTQVKKYISSEDLRGASIAIEAINAQGGLLGRRINLVEGRAFDNLQLKAEVTNFIAQKGLFAVVGANLSNFSLTLAPILQKAGIPMITPISTNPKVTLVGDYIFRACFTDPFQGKVMAGFAKRELGAKKAALLVKVTSKYSTSLARYFKEEFAKQGEIVYEGNYLGEDVDFAAILAKVKEMNPDVVFVPGHGRDVGMIMKQAHAMGIKTAFLGGDGWGKGALGIAGSEAAEGHYFCNHWHMDVTRPSSRDFVQAYRKKFGDKLIASSAPLAHDAVMMLARAVKKAQSLDGAKIRDALANSPGYEGITGFIKFGPTRDPIDKEAAVLKYQNGGIVFVKTVKP